MTEIFQRFLSSIGIENQSLFEDMEFDYFVRDRFNPNKWNIQICKEEPWSDFDTLNYFLESLKKINYDYSLRFTYHKQPTVEDAYNLFQEWHHSVTRVNYQGEFEIKDNRIVFYGDEKDPLIANAVSDYKAFLDFLNYDAEVVIEPPIEKEEVPSVSKREYKKILKEATNAAIEEINTEDEEEEIMDSSEIDIAKQIEEEHYQTTKEVEEIILEQMRANAEQMRRERERQRLNRRGNYQVIELIDAIDSNSGNVDFVGKIYSVEMKDIRGRMRINLGFCDKHGGAITGSVMENSSIDREFQKQLVKGTNLRVRGVAYIDSFSKELTIKIHFLDLLPPDELRVDNAPEKRVELHLHSTMSTQDGVGTMDAYCHLAKNMGHEAIAITDHGVVQGYPDAQAAGKKYGIKILYGSELYMVDDQLVYAFNPKDIKLNKTSYVVLDLETTGLSTFYDRIIEFGAVKVENGLVTHDIDILINPERKLPEKIVNITHITDEMLQNKPKIEDVIDKILDFIGDSVLVTHNAAFDFGFLQETLKRLGRPILQNSVIDTLALSRYLFPESKYHNLGTLCRNMEIKYDADAAHRANYDAEVLNSVWQPMLVQLTKTNRNMTVKDLMSLETPKALLTHIRPTHVTALAMNKVGLKNLYKIVSLSHVEYFAEVPKTPRKELSNHREGLLLGSACFNGDVFQTARYYNFERLKQVISFYDFIEVQPPENYSYLINMGEIESEEVLLTYLKDIIRAADEVGVMVCATGDCHYVNPEDKAFRDVYIFSQAVGGINHALNPYDRTKRKLIFENPDQHYRSTEEMMEAFSFLGDEEKIKEIVVTNPNKINNMIEALVPLPNDKLYAPKIEGCEDDLKNIVYTKAHDMYGEELPEYIKNRLETELNGIITNGFSVIYYIAHKIVKKANEDGYMIGSRGSVGSSFVATMAGITEVNPLPPHYRCPECKTVEWTSNTYPDVKSGYDLPEKRCPVCGSVLERDGQNIPFETFLGFHAEKTPDIDLNIPSDYQARAHNYTKVLLGESNVFRAGTIETVAEKTAFGFARGYLERSFIMQGMSKEEAAAALARYPKAKIAYLAAGCEGVKRTTGQHPGGIVVVPNEYEVYDFTPIQYPADEQNAEWKTTHFDFHSIHETILKLDLLGHVDPLALKMMSDISGIDINTIPLNDPKVLSIFSSPQALGLKKNYLAQRTGALAIPEFGTNFVRGILEATRPKTFSELVIISGLSHGTNVWTGNADDLIKQGKTLREVIGCRDDIMTYLMDKEIPSEISFAIMEKVRKGKGVDEVNENIMRQHAVPQFYIDSCNKIKYMFPKGHATAYVMQAIRVGYFKVYHPLVFYAVFFSVRSKQYDIETMIKGEYAIIEKVEELRNKETLKGEKLSPKEKEQQKTLEIAIEMTDRGYSFGNIDLNRSLASEFVIDYERRCLIPPFTTIDGLGEAAAQSVVDARKDGEFYSEDDLLRRTKLNTTNVKQLRKLGVLKGMSKGDQLSLFDWDDDED